MNRLCFLIVAICLSLPTLCSIAAAESANPFGFETDRDPLAYGYCKKNRAFRSHGYTCESAPLAHPDIDTYTLQFVKGIGLCRIEISQRYTGSEVAPAELFKQQIIAAYGQPINKPPASNSQEDMEPAFSEITEGQDNDHKEQRFYWKPEGAVQSIELTVSTFPDVVTFMHIYIKFTAFAACQQAIDKKGREAFKGDTTTP